MKVKKAVVRRPTSFDLLRESVAHQYAHQHTVTINSHARVLEFEGGEVDRAVVALTAALADKRRRRQEINASLSGLASVVEKR